MYRGMSVCRLVEPWRFVHLGFQNSTLPCSGQVVQLCRQLLCTVTTCRMLLQSTIRCLLLLLGCACPVAGPAVPYGSN